jgi:hypothetical protein
VISGFRRDVDEICALLGYHAALSLSSISTFRDNLLFPFSGVMKSKKKALKMGPIGCPETSAQNYRSTLLNIPEARRCHARYFVQRVAVRSLNEELQFS